MYNNYNNLLKTLDISTLIKSQFKNNYHYCGILEHVSTDLGLDSVVVKFSAFSPISKRPSAV